MFGGVGFLLNGNMLVGVWKDSLIVRLGPDQGEEALLEPHVKEFDITGRPMKGWVLVEPEGVEDDDQLKRLDSAGDEVRREVAGEVTETVTIWQNHKSRRTSTTTSRSSPPTFRRSLRKCGKRSATLRPKRRKRSAT